MTSRLNPSSREYTPPKLVLADLDLDLKERCTIRRWYRILRIAQYAPQSSPHAANSMYQGAYGMGRDEARTWLSNVAREVAWHIYIGSK